MLFTVKHYCGAVLLVRPSSAIHMLDQCTMASQPPRLQMAFPQCSTTMCHPGQ